MRIFLIGIFTLSIFFLPSLMGHAQTNNKNDYESRMELYKKMESVTNIPWYYLAAIERLKPDLVHLISMPLHSLGIA